MSNKRLLEATAEGWYGPYYDLPPIKERIQSAYQEGRFKRKPIKVPFLQHFAEGLLALIFRKVKFDPNFVTKDGTRWIAISLLYKSDIRYKLAFPITRDRHHENGTVSGHHVALYCSADEEPSSEELSQVAQALGALFEGELRDFDFRHI